MSGRTETALPPEVAGWDLLKRPIWLFDPVSCRGLYANSAALALWGAVDLDELLARDFSKLSPAARARTDRLAAATAQGATVTERWTFYPCDVPTTVQAAISTFALPGGRTALLFEAAPLDTEEEAIRALESLRHTPSVVSMFDGFGGCLMSNPAAFAVYGEVDHGLVRRFVVADEGLAFMDDVLERGRHSIIAEVTTSNGPERRYLDGCTLTDPVNGQACILVAERPAEARADDLAEIDRLKRSNDELKAALRRLMTVHEPRAA